MTSILATIRDGMALSLGAALLVVVVTPAPLWLLPTWGVYLLVLELLLRWVESSLRLRRRKGDDHVE